jgi:parallel beta-helix repeat protein
MKRALFTGLFLWATGLLIAGPLHATIYYVDSSVTDTNVISATCDFTTYNPVTFSPSTGSACVYATLVDVIVKGSFSAGDSILFRKGQTFTWTNPTFTSVAGSSGNVITFGAFGSGAAPIIDGTGQSWGVKFATASYLTFTGLDIRNASGPGMWFAGTLSNITIDGLYVSNNTNGIQFDAGSSIIVKNSTIYSNVKMGIALVGVSNSTFQSNTIYGNCITIDPDTEWCGGIRITGSDSVGDIFERNTVYSQVRGAGIWLDFNGSGQIVRYNKLYGNRNSVYPSQGAGIYNEVTSGTLIYYNVSYDNGTGIWVEGRAGDYPQQPANSNEVYNNTAYNNIKYGMLLMNGGAGIQGYCHGNIFKNNISYGTTDGPDLMVGGNAEKEINTFDYNSFGAERSNQFEIGWTNFESTYAGALDALINPATGNASNVFTNNVTTSPALISATDLRLAAGSSAINAGTSVGLTVDYTGRTVIGAPDLGAYEFYQSYAPWFR